MCVDLEVFDAVAYGYCLAQKLYRQTYRRYLGHLKQDCDLKQV